MSILSGLARFAQSSNTVRGAIHYGGNFAATSAQLGAMSIVGRSIHYAGNELMPNVALGPDELMRLKHAGRIDEDTLRKSLWVHGISIDASSAYNLAAQHWRTAFDLVRSKPSDSTVLDLFLRGKISRQEAEARLHELGYSNERERELLLNLDSQLSESVILGLYHQGKMERSEAEQQLLKLGYLSEYRRDVLFRHENPLNTGDVILLMLRGWITPEEADELLKRNGYRIDEERQKLLALSQYIPPVTDLVRFVIKDVFDENIVREMGWDDEYQEQRQRYEFWCQSQGLGTMTLPDNPDGNPINWPLMYYRANWQNISPTQAYIALHRLRPTTVETGEPRNPNGVVFTRDDMERILRISDYPQRQRDWLIETSYLPLTRVDLRRMYDLGTLGSKLPDRQFDPTNVSESTLSSPAGRELYESYQDIGYDERDATRLAAFTISEERVRRSKQVLGNARAAIADAYKTGVLSFEDAAIRLYRLRLDDPAKRAEFDGMPRREQALTARQDRSTLEALTQLDLQADTQIVKQWIRSIKTGYITGRWNRTQAFQQLVQLGITEDRRDRYISLWDAQRSGSRRMLSISQVMKYARYGIISRDDLLNRLRNLGYNTPDSVSLASDVERNVILDTNRALERAARNEQQRRRAIERQLRELRREQTATERRLLRLGTPSQLSSWVVRGLLRPDSMLARLIALGITRVDAELKVAEAMQLREERLRRQSGQTQRG